MTGTPTPSPRLIILREKLPSMIEKHSMKTRRKFLRVNFKFQGLQCRMEKDERERAFDYND